MADVILIRGLPGAGKTTEAVSLNRPVTVAADDYFTNESGEYNFNPRDLGLAHAWCKMQALTGMKNGMPVVVHNTFTQRWEMEPYLLDAERLGLSVEIRSVFDGGCTDEELAERNTHGVPLSAIQAMRQRWEENWKDADPLPPWDR